MDHGCPADLTFDVALIVILSFNKSSKPELWFENEYVSSLFCFFPKDVYRWFIPISPRHEWDFNPFPLEGFGFVIDVYPNPLRDIMP